MDRFLGKGRDLADPRFLVIGASGLIGQRLLRALGPTRAVGTHYRNRFSGSVSFDLATDKVTELLDRLGQPFTHAVILAGVVNIDACARDPSGSAAANVEGSIRATEGLIARDIVPIFASSDAIYDGSRGMWHENDETESMLTYGRQKRAVERHLERQSAPWIALRIAKVLDPELGQTGVLGPWITELAAGKLIRCATDQRFCPLGVDDVVAAICLLAEARATGIFNLGGPEPVSRIELLERLIATLSRRRSVRPLIEPCSLSDLPFLERRPLDLTMSIEKLSARVAFRPKDLTELCVRAARNAAAQTS
jgi:dTDP-4-dehydrorhamnose reductase